MRNLKRRLSKLADSLAPGGQMITAVQYADETEEDARARIARWEAGEPVEGASARPCETDLEIILRYFGRRRDGSFVTEEDYEGLVPRLGGVPQPDEAEY